MSILKKLFGKKDENIQPAGEASKPTDADTSINSAKENQDSQNVIDSSEFATKYLAAGKSQDVIALMGLASKDIRCNKCKKISNGRDARVHPVVFKCPNCDTVWFNGLG